jgi:flagellar assembly factor FliW
MSLTFESIRFGTVEIPQEDAIEFPLGLIGLGGLRYALLDRNPGTGFFWLHSLEDPALALLVVDPRRFFSAFTLELSEEDRERTGVEDPAEGELWVTVRATPDPLDIMVNLRAPLIVSQGRGHQVINRAEHAPLQAPLFVMSTQSPTTSDAA